MLFAIYSIEIFFLRSKHISYASSSFQAVANIKERLEDVDSKQINYFHNFFASQLNRKGEYNLVFWSFEIEFLVE